MKVRSILDSKLPSRITTNKTYHLSTEERFWSSVNKKGDNECWEWKGNLERNGYGVFNSIQSHFKAHRCAWEFVNGRIPDGLYICHKCDNRKCVNPSHLFIGTQGDNLRDMVSKGRGNFNPLRGEKHPRHKLTDIQIRSMRQEYEDGMSCIELGKKYGVHKAQATKIVFGRIRTDA